MRWIKKFGRIKPSALSLMIFSAAAFVVVATALATGVSAAKGQAAAPDATPLTIPPVNKLSNEYVKVAKMLEPSVVYIETEYVARRQTTSQRRQSPQLEEPDEDAMPELFRRWFGQPMPMPGPNPRQFRRQGAGSGFIVDKNGYIITNYHVVDDAENIKVKLSGDKREYKAKVIGYDAETDVAVIKIDAGRPLTPVKISNSDGVQVGDSAIAIGAPFELEMSVTAGIVSALGRDITPRQFQHFIQTDAAINPGNSGGPLVNINGEVIGVNTMIATMSGGYQGIGFALPINMAAKVYNDIIRHGRVTRGSIGITFSKEIKPETMKALGLKNGVIVDRVTEGGPAEAAGLKPEDIILALNGKPIRDGDDLVARISDMPVGSEVTLELDRDGKRIEKKVAIADREKVHRDLLGIKRPRMTDPEEKTENTSVRFGIGIGALTEDRRKDLKFTEDHGVLVTTVEEGSFAEEIGLQERDIIVSINRQPVSSFEDVKRIQSQLKPGDAVAFRVLRAAPSSVRGQVQWIGQYLSGTLPKE
jgi:serine protease Do